MHEIHISEKRTTRLPYPYTSNCTDGKIVSNLFSDRYTFPSCLETCAFNYMLKECNDVIDFWKKYRTADAKPFNNSKYNNRRECMRSVVKLIRQKATSICSCQNACEETSYTVEKKSKPLEYGFSFWVIKLYNEGAVTEVNLVPDFPPEQFLGTFGGVLGLGGKLQLVFQFLVFILLCIGHLFVRNR